MSISKEAIEAAWAAYQKFGWSTQEGMEKALEAALPFLPIAGEGKVKALEWNPFTAYTPFGYHYSVWERDNGVWECNLLDGQFKTLEAIRAAAQTDFETRILSALISSPGKDGGKEVEAVKPSIDTMREAAWALLRKFGWQPTARLSLHQVSEVMAAFGMNVSRGEVGCGYPDCGCCADAACEDAIKQHADFRTQTASTALVESDPTDEFLAQVAKELKRARAKFPGDRIMTIALAEEFGELAKAMLDENGEAVWKEAVQTAVMAARVAIDGDSSVDEWRAAKGLDNHRLAGRSALSASQSTSREGER